MFGHDNNHKDDNQIPEDSIQGALSSEEVMTPNAPVEQPATDNSNAGWGHPGTPLNDGGAQAPAPVDDQPAQGAASPAPASAIHLTPAPATPETNADSLIDIKQQALGQLSPIFEHLEQMPEEKFRTTMMMIQATDNQDLIPKAYEAANAIEDEKTKAQALLDVINEINYFTQQGHHHE